jgi:hypothetical protein
VQFVLDGGHLVLRAEDRKMLLHEGAGTHVLSAWVEITFDNADGRMPVDKEEVVIRRVVGLKKDEYYIDRRHCTKNEARRTCICTRTRTCIRIRARTRTQNAHCNAQHSALCPLPFARARARARASR